MLSPLLGQIVWLNGKKGNHYSTGLLRLPPQVEVTGCPLLCQAAPQTARLWQAGGKSLGLLQITDSCFRGWWVSRWPLLAPYEPYFSLLPIHVRVGCPRWPQPLVSLRVTAEQGKSFPGLRDENFRLWAPTRTSCVGSLPSSPPFFFFFLDSWGNPRELIGQCSLLFWVYSHSRFQIYAYVRGLSVRLPIWSEPWALCFAPEHSRLWHPKFENWLSTCPFGRFQLEEPLHHSRVLLSSFLVYEYFFFSCRHTVSLKECFFNDFTQDF